MRNNMTLWGFSCKDKRWKRDNMKLFLLQSREKSENVRKFSSKFISVGFWSHFCEKRNQNRRKFLKHLQLNEGWKMDRKIQRSQKGEVSVSPVNEKNVLFESSKNFHFIIKQSLKKHSNQEFSNKETISRLWFLLFPKEQYNILQWTNSSLLVVMKFEYE